MITYPLVNSQYQLPASTNLGPATQAPWVLYMQRDWPLILALLGKTRGLRARGEQSLPKWPKEPDEAYKARLAKSTCFGFFADAVDDLAARPLEKPITYKGTLPEQLEALKYDTNGEEAPLESLAKAWLSQAMAYGAAHIWVDYSIDEPMVTMAAERAAGARPVFRLLHPCAVLDAEVNGQGKIVHLRIFEVRQKRTGYLLEDVPHVLEWNLLDSGFYEFKLHQQPKVNSDWQLIRGPERYPLKELPIATLNLCDLPRFQADPPLLTLAELEESHWLHNSDHANNLSIVSAGGLFVTGITQGEADKGWVMGASAFNASQNPDARASWIEPRGEALQQRSSYIGGLEAKMREHAARPLTQQISARTATEVASADGRSQTVLQHWVRRLEAALIVTFEHAADWLKLSIPEDFAVNCYSDWQATAAQDVHLRTLDNARARGDIDQITYLEEMQRRGVLSADSSPEDIQAATEQETPEPQLLEFGAAPGAEQQAAQGAPQADAGAA